MDIIGQLREFGGCQGGKLIYEAAKDSAESINSVPGAYRIRHELKAETKRRMWFIFPDLDFNRIRFCINSNLPANWFRNPNDVESMTFGYKIFFKGSNIQTTENGLRLLVHELVHVDQVRRRGDDESKFACDYGTGYLNGGSYEANPLEIEAYQKLPYNVALPRPVENITHFVFAKSMTGDAFCFYWSPQPDWQAESISLTSNAPLACKVSGMLVSAISPGWNMPDVFGRNNTGQLIHYYWSARPAWAVENLTNYQNIGNNFAFLSDPVVDSFMSGNTPTQHVFARNSINELIHYYWDPSNSWAAENLTRRQNIGSAYSISNDPVVNKFKSGSIQTQHVFGCNSNNELIHYYWDLSQGWSAENLTKRPNIGINFKTTGNPVVNSFMTGSTPAQHIFGRNDANELIHFFWSPSSGWAAENLTKHQNIGNNFKIIDDPVVISFLSGNSQAQHVFGRNSANEIIHYYWDPSNGWAAENLTKLSNIGSSFIIVSKPVIYYIILENNPSLNIFGRNASNHLIHYSWNPSSGWKAENLTMDYGNIGQAFVMTGDIIVSSFIAGINPILNILGTPSLHVYGYNAANELIHYYWNSSTGWGADNLTNQAGTQFRISLMSPAKPLFIQLKY